MRLRVGQYFKFTKKKKISRITNINHGVISLRNYSYKKGTEGFMSKIKSSRLIQLFNRGDFTFVSPKEIISILMEYYYFRGRKI